MKRSIPLLEATVVALAALCATGCAGMKYSNGLEAHDDAPRMIHKNDDIATVLVYDFLLRPEYKKPVQVIDRRTYKERGEY